MKYYDSGRYHNNYPDDSNHSRSWLSDTRVVDHRLEWILLIAEKSKFILRGTDDMTIRLPVEYIHSMGWELNEEVIISNAWWDSQDQCHRIQLERANPPEKKGRWAK